MGGSGLFHEDHVPTIPAFSSLDHATYTAEVHWYTCLLWKKAQIIHSQYRPAMPLNTYCSRKSALSQKQSIISVIIFVIPVSCIARRRMLYAYFLMSARLFRDFLAGERSSLNVLSNTWWSRFSIDQCILFMMPSSSAVRIRSDISAVHGISFPAPSPALQVLEFRLFSF